MTLLDKLGLMWIADHEAVGDMNDQLGRENLRIRARFNRAAADLAALSDENAALRPDAERWRERQAKARGYEATRRVRKGAKP